MLLAGRTRWLWWTSAGIGAFWGVWSTTLWIPENTEDPELLAENGTLHVLDGAEFALYAFGFSAILAVGHFALDRTWRTSFEVPRWLRVVGALWVGMFLVTWSLAYPSAIPMFAGCIWLQVWLLRRRRPLEATPPLLQQLNGRISARSLLPLITTLPATASTVYALASAWQPDHSVPRTIMWTTIALQTLGAAAILIWAVRSPGSPSSRQHRRAGVNPPDHASPAGRPAEELS